MVRSVGYQVRARVEGQLPTAWSGLFSGLDITLDPAGTTLVVGEVADQAALHGLLDTMRDLGVVLVSVEAVAVPHEPAQPGGSPCRS